MTGTGTVGLAGGYGEEGGELLAARRMGKRDHY
jgi:hypothetical protein